eukprot:jgi/Mesen1/6056/ME000309S05189
MQAPMPTVHITTSSCSVLESPRVECPALYTIRKPDYSFLLTITVGRIHGNFRQWTMLRTHRLLQNSRRLFDSPATRVLFIVDNPLKMATDGSSAAATKSAIGGASEPPLGPLASKILPHILNLYNLKASPADFEVYAPKATFEDPLMKASGVKEIKSAFYSLEKLFRESRVVDYSVEETETSPGSGEIRVDNTQHYNFFGRSFDMVSLIKLQVENGKVIEHVDMWKKNPISKATFPLRKANMALTHLLMGFGKDPKPSASSQ